MQRLNAVHDLGVVHLEVWFNEEREADRSWDVDPSEWRFDGSYVPRRTTLGVGNRIPIAELADRRPDVFVQECDRGYLAVGFVAARAVARRTAFRALPSFDAWSRRTRWREASKGFVFRAVDGVKVPGALGRTQALRYGVPADRVHTVAQSVDLRLYGSADRVAGTKRDQGRRERGLSGCVFIFVGRIWKGKGLDELLAAYGRMRVTGVEASLLIVGNGVDEDVYRQAAADMGQVHFEGFCQPTDLPALYGLADVLVFPTHGDPNGLVIEEAFAAGLPVISSDAAGDVRERVPERKAGIIFPVGDVDALANAMATLAGDAALREAMGLEGKRLVQRLAPAQYAKDFTRFIEATLALPRRRGVASAFAGAMGRVLVYVESAFGAAHGKTEGAGGQSLRCSIPASTAMSEDQLSDINSTTTDPLPGKGLQQSHEEWDTRNRVLAETIGALIERYLPAGAERALDVGCQRGALTDVWMRRTGMDWWGIDPTLDGDIESRAGAHLSHGFSNALHFADGEFDCAVFANVYEHVFPEQRRESLGEIFRVLKPGGIVVGQIPNPYFPIESHSRLPFMGWLPMSLQKQYWKLSPVPWEHDFFVVTMRHLTADASAAGFEMLERRNFNYPPEVIPQQVRWAARALERPMRKLPWAWQFVLRRPAT